MKTTNKTTTTKEYSLQCTKCGQWISGTSESQVLYNLKIHQTAPKHLAKIKGNRGSSETPAPLSHS